MTRKRGFFITFEGGENLGKTTQLKRLSERLIKEGYDVENTFEPGRTDLGTVLRDLVKHYKGRMSKATEMFLFQADRAQTYKEIVKPALKAGKIVLGDRFVHSTIVYQGALRGWSIPFLWRLHNAATGMLIPDLTFVFDGEPFCEGDPTDRFEAEGAEFHKRIRQAYKWQAQVSNGRCVVINANQDPDALTDGIYKIIKERLLRK
jgi:dTMP kinase